MLKLIQNLTHDPRATLGLTFGYDFSSIESVDEFRGATETATIIFGLDKMTRRGDIAFGREMLQAIASEVVPVQQLAPVAFVVDFNSQEEVARFCQMVEAVKGACEWKAEQPDKFVTVYDLATHSRTTIPAAELAPGMVQANVEGQGSVWVKASQIKKAPIRHKPFTNSVRKELRLIEQALKEVYPRSLAEWEDGFRRDENPTREIALWKRIVSVYQAAIAGVGFTKAQRVECFGIIVRCTTTPADKVLEVTALSALSREQAQAIIGRYFQTT